MLIRFEAANYKNFKEPITIDFGSVGGYQFNADCITNEIVSKMLIYGKNGTGKTNLGGAVMDLARACGTMPDIDCACGRMPDVVGVRGTMPEDGEHSKPVKFEYLFRFDQTRVQYGYSRNADGSFQTEALYVDDAKIFDFDYANRWFWHGNLELIAAETILVEHFLENREEDDTARRISFLRWLFANAVFPKDAAMARLRSYVNGMRFFKVPDMTLGGLTAEDYRFLQTLKGEQKQQFEEYLDAVGVHTDAVSMEVPFSDGILMLLHFYRNIITKLHRLSCVYLDGFDTFLHYETAEKLFCWLKEKYPDCQIVLTSHNTHLMTNRLTRPDCACVLRRDGKLMPLNRAASRELREGHNLEKLYMSGEFEGSNL